MRITSFTSYLDAVFEDVARTRETAAFPVHKFLTEDDNLFKQEDSAVMKLQLVCSGMTTCLCNLQAIL